jgi:hypothetical protein
MQKTSAVLVAIKNAALIYVPSPSGGHKANNDN